MTPMQITAAALLDPAARQYLATNLESPESVERVADAADQILTLDQCRRVQMIVLSYCARFLGDMPGTQDYHVCVDSRLE
jgi:hypothetical protein